VSSAPIRYAIVDGMNVRDSRVHNYPPRWNGAPSQDLLVIRRNRKTGEVSLDPLRWGLILYWCEDPKGGRKPINAKCETVRTLPSFREAYRKRRCILPVDGFFEWKAIKGQKAKQPYAIAMKNGSPFGIGGLWENWKEFGGVIVPLLRFWCGARRYAHLTHLDCAVGVPFLWCCYR
jgi:putative SOS response-associated peptidase YedK